MHPARMQMDWMRYWSMRAPNEQLHQGAAVRAEHLQRRLLTRLQPLQRHARGALRIAPGPSLSLPSNARQARFPPAGPQVPRAQPAMRSATRAPTRPTPPSPPEPDRPRCWPRSLSVPLSTALVAPAHADHAARTRRPQARLVRRTPRRHRLRPRRAVPRVDGGDRVHEPPRAGRGAARRAGARDPSGAQGRPVE